MRISKINIKNFRSFENSGDLDFRNINIITGANNSGKSSIIRAIYLLQKGQNELPGDTHINSDYPRISIALEDLDLPPFQPDEKSKSALVEIGNGSKHYKILDSHDQQDQQVIEFTGTESNKPENFIVPCFASRATSYLNTSINDQYLTQTSPDFSGLPTELTGFVGSGLPEANKFEELSKELFGIEITIRASSNNQVKLTYRVTQNDQIYIDNMGTGVPHILKLLYDLVTSDGKLFLIEEIETAIHPMALKRILGLIQDCSTNNQFVLTTHSHIVVSFLANTDNSALFYVDQKIGGDRIPCSSCIAVGDDDREYQQVLAALGNELSDLYLWKGWLILEESSAETIINELLIPWFCPELKGQLCSVSAKGNSRAKSQFNALAQQFVYVHLTPIYQNKAWVILDKGKEGEKFINELKASYQDKWEGSNFRNWSKAEFEQYYPESFEDQVAELEKLDRQEKQAAKKKLLIDVIAWARENEDTAKDEFESSADEVIRCLKDISQALNTSSKEEVTDSTK